MLYIKSSPTMAMVLLSRVVSRGAISIGSTVEKPTGLTTLNLATPEASGSHESSHWKRSLCACIVIEQMAKAIVNSRFIKKQVLFSHKRQCLGLLHHHICHDTIGITFAIDEVVE